MTVVMEDEGVAMVEAGDQAGLTSNKKLMIKWAYTSLLCRGSFSGETVKKRGKKENMGK